MIIGPARDDRERIGVLGEGLEAAACEPETTLDRLVGVGRRTDDHGLACP
jgi:hypothetical protein